MTAPLRFSRRDWAQLAGYWLLGSAGCFLMVFWILDALLAPALMEAISDRITRSVVLIEAARRHQPTMPLPPGIRVAVAAAGGPPGSFALRSCFDRRLVADLRRHHGIERPLRRDGEPLVEPFGGYWVALRGVPAPQWVYVPSSFASLPQFWPLVSSFSLIGGTLVALLLFLHQRVDRPLRLLLEALPLAVPESEAMQPVPEAGVEPVQALARRVNQMIEQHNRRAAARRDLLRGFSHDLRGPLTRLLLRSEKLRRPSEPALVRQDLTAIDADLQQLRELAEQLTALTSAADPGSERRSFSLEALCARVAESYPGGQVQVQVPRLLVKVDQELLQRSLINLIDNALEYGAPPVLISAERRRVPGLQILVDDHGGGLVDYSSGNQAMLPRADDRERQRHRGIGLEIVRHFCSEHGGELRLEPAPSGGLRACLQLPPAVLV